MSEEKLPRSFVENLMFGTGRVRRFTQDSPVLPDVWLAYANALEDQSVVPSRYGAMHLLLTPYKETPPGVVRNELAKLVEKNALSARAQFGHEQQLMPIIYNLTTVSAELYFEDLIRAVLPLTAWWQSLAAQIPFLKEKETNTRRLLALAVQNPENPGLHFSDKDRKTEDAEAVLKLPPDVFWLVRVVGAMTLALRKETKKTPRLFDPKASETTINREWRRVVDAVADLVSDIDPNVAQPLIYTASLNRAASMSIAKSTLAVKADAARQLFNISCKEIRWALIDCGIEAQHPAFRKDATKPPFFKDEKGASQNNTRIVGTYDFSVVHRLLDKMNPEIPPRFLDLSQRNDAEGAQAKKQIERLKTMLDEGDTIDWRIVAPMLEIPHEDGCYQSPPATLDHGTHVAGILGGNWKKTEQNKLETDLIGVCPDINFYDVRVISAKGIGGEFAIMTAMQFVRWLNTTHATQGVHGTNLSLSIRHDVSNYACGRTPVCDEAERLVAAGVVVVTAAGNYGHRRYSTPEGTAEAYNSISIVDPGNAEGVITVGATHRFKPHTYGVSYFSSRGPTGDGRVKPDLVAPGEKITSAIRIDASGVKDGTSMAAPHVSGAAALLMARHQELVGNPARIKEILCSTATDLGRERYFQGHGMLDVLRALQAV